MARDEWIKQAKALAKGGVEEYRKVFGKPALMLADQDRIFTNLYGTGRLGPRRRPGTWRLWRTPRSSSMRGRDWIVNEVKGSGLRGRGGAGFPTALKWTFMPKEGVNDGRPSQLLVNADESEPGTCKDREILRHDPHHLVEGCLLAGRAMGAHIVCLHSRRVHPRARRISKHAVQQAYDAKLIGKNNIHGWDFDIVVHHGAGAYICGEETALMESLEGKKGQPRLKPPFPAAMGVYGNPTTVNNVESIAVVPEILRRGGAWFAGIGRANNTGTKLFMASGHVNKPAVFEDALGCSPSKNDREALRRHPRRLGQPSGGDPGRRLLPGGAGEDMRTAIMDFDGMRDEEVGVGRSAPPHDRDGQVDRHHQGDLAHPVGFLQA